jgi:hypothetical protein
MEEPTKPMRTEAAAAGFVDTAWGRYPRLQIWTIAELMDGHKIDAPAPLDVTYKQAPRDLGRVAEKQVPFALEPPPSDDSKKSKMVKASLPLGFRQAKQRRKR